MLGLFKRTQPVLNAEELGRSMVALPLRTGCTPPGACSVLIVDASGHTRRAAPAKRVELRDGEQGWAWHPGPYTVDLAPFAQASEAGLRTSFAIEPELDGARQRFDLLLAAEGNGPLSLAALARALEVALQRELAAGSLELPPCTTIEEWNLFRQGFNQLCYMRFGLSVDDCVPVDLGALRDHAALLAARAAAAGEPPSLRIEPVLGAPAPAPAAGVGAGDAAHDGAAPCPVGDARAVRRLFLELPGLMCGLRLAALPAGQDQFRRQQALLQRLDLLSVSASTMPALELAAPGQPLATDVQARRARHARRACVSLDEAWALLARFRAQDARDGAGDPEGGAALYDEAERIVANLEFDCGARRAAIVSELDAGAGAGAAP